MTLWIVSLISIALGLGAGVLIRGILDSQKLLQAELRAERAERKHDNEIASAIIQSTEAGSKPVPFVTGGELANKQQTFLAKNLERFGGVPEIHSDDLELMFLDQLLIRFFHTLMPKTLVFPSSPSVSRLSSSRPWKSFVGECSWAEEMPLLFELGWGYKLNEFQLNNAIAEYARRISKTPTAVNPPRAETPVQPEKDYTGV